MYVFKNKFHRGGLQDIQNRINVYKNHTFLYTRMDCNVCCCLTVRNCGRFLPLIFENLELLSKEFSGFHVVFVYDNCCDNSESLLNSYKESSAHPVYVIHNIGNNSSLRTERIASSRNKCLDIVYNTIQNIDYHFMIDADDRNIKKWNVQIIKDCFQNDTWESISFNREKYYDIWGLMYDNIKQHCWGYKPSQPIVTYMENDITKKLNKMQNDELFECFSAFNGFAIYRTPVFKDILYDGNYFHIKTLISDDERRETVLFLQTKLNIGDLCINEEYSECCEHLYYHISAIQQKNARIRISKHCL